MALLILGLAVGTSISACSQTPAQAEVDSISEAMARQNYASPGLNFRETMTVNVHVDAQGGSAEIAKLQDDRIIMLWRARA